MRSLFLRAVSILCLLGGLLTVSCGSDDVESAGAAISAITVGNCSAVGADQVCVCTSPNFLGQCAVLNGGVHFYPMPATIGLPNDSIASILTGSGVRARYCVDDQMRNTCATLGPNAQLKTMTGNPGPGSISSMRIDRVSDVCASPGARQVSVFSGNNFTGDCAVLTLPAGMTEADFPNTTSPSDANGLNGSFGLPNDSVSSIIVGSGVRAALFANAGFADVANLDLGVKQAIYEPGRYATGAPAPTPSLGSNADKTATAFIITEHHGGTIAMHYTSTLPYHSQPVWGQDIDGLAHDSQYWYVTNKWNVYRYKLTDNLDGSANYRWGMEELTIPSPRGPLNLDNDLHCAHFGDPDVTWLAGQPWLLIPFEQCHDPVTDDEVSFLAVFDISQPSMPLRCVDELYFQPTNAAFVAVNPQSPSILYSAADISGSPGDPGYHPLFTYQINENNLATCDLSRCLADFNAGAGWGPGCLLWNGPGDSTQPLQLAAGVYHGAQTIVSRKIALASTSPADYNSLTKWQALDTGRGINLGEPQGGVFSPDGKLFYFSNGGSYQGNHRDTNALRVFDTTTPVWTEITRAWDDYYGWFSYACAGGCSSGWNDEPEGLDYLDMSTVSGAQFGGKLHALLYNNDCCDQGYVYLKHYDTKF